MIPVPYSTTTNSGSSNASSDKVCVGGVVIESLTTFTWDNIIIGQGDTVNGTISNPTPTLNLPVNTPCLGEHHSYNLYLNDVRLNNCPCCTVTVINPAPIGIPL